MSENKSKTEQRPFFEDDSDEPTIVWVRPRRRLRGFTRRVHFLNRPPLPPAAEPIQDDDSTLEDDTRREDDTVPEHPRWADEDTRV